MSTTSRGYDNNDYHNGMTFHNLDQVEPSTNRFSPIRLRSDDQEYQNHEITNYNKRQSPQP